MFVAGPNQIQSRQPVTIPEPSEIWPGEIGFVSMSTIKKKEEKVNRKAGNFVDMFKQVCYKEDMDV